MGEDYLLNICGKVSVDFSDKFLNIYDDNTFRFLIRYELHLYLFTLYVGVKENKGYMDRQREINTLGNKYRTLIQPDFYFNIN